ncbi:MAG: efflux RND transporter periplasmic adaptor subunit [Cyclobacteriaceae bacterium]
MKNLQNNLKPALGLLVLGMILGMVVVMAIINGGEDEDNLASHMHTQDSVVVTPQGEVVWTCSMHPQIRQPQAGDCPICGMDLIPMELDEDGDPMAVRMSASAMRLANIQTTLVGTSGSASRTLRLDGRIVQDESREYSQVAQYPGRIEQLYINVTGEEVKRGQRIASIYSPELVTAQRELLEAQDFKDSNPALYEAARQKLRNWKLSNAQIDRIIATGHVSNTLTIFAERNGVVTEKMVNPGDYVKQGDVLFAVANLEELWAVFNVYESELPLLQEGDEVMFTVQAVPGATFSTTINFVNPTMNTSERTATARGQIKNRGDQLKPGMLISGRLEAETQAGTSMLQVPRSAVLWTGTRSVVYVKVSGTEQPSFMMREVTLGKGAGDSYVVAEGLKAGERVVTNGAFSVDAAAQLNNKPSMMNEVETKEESPVITGDAYTLSGEVGAQMQAVLKNYLYIKDLLVAAKAEEVNNHADSLVQALTDIDETKIPANGRHLWHGLKERMLQSARNISRAESIDTQRKLFVSLSEAMIGMVSGFSFTDQSLYLQHCPMADDNTGGAWLSLNEQVRNPYYGDMMLTCGEVRAVLNSNE